jgi:ATP phosphoribosyltransferase
MTAPDSPTLRLAIPKGRLVETTLQYLFRANLIDADSVDVGRRLVVPLAGAVDRIGMPLELLLLKNADVPTYVEHGVADIGISGTDVLDEQLPDVYRPLTLPYGSCRIAIAAREHVRDEQLRALETLRVATKYPRTARTWFDRQGVSVELIELGGSVELAAALGLSDVIVDLVETGKTLVENHLRVVEVIGVTEVKVIANRALAPDRAAAVDRILLALQEVKP